MTLWLVRHTSLEGSAGLCYGRTELPLASTFQSEAESIQARLPAGPRIVYSSPSVRCVRLAELLGRPVRLEPRLQELGFGAWEGRPWATVARAESDAWAADFVNRAPPGGECFLDLARRAARWADDVVRWHDEHTVVAVTHAGVIRALAAHANGRELEDAFAMAVPIGAVVEIEWRESTPRQLRA